MATHKREFKFNDEIVTTIAENVTKYRKLMDVTQEQLAVDVDKSPEFIRKFESTKGSEGIKLVTLYKISVVLGVRIDKFFE